MLTGKKGLIGIKLMACWLAVIIIIITVNYEISRVVTTTKRLLRGLCAYNRVCTNGRHASSRSSAQTPTNRALAGCQKGQLYTKFSKQVHAYRALLSDESSDRKALAMQYYTMIQYQFPFFSHVSFHYSSYK